MTDSASPPLARLLTILAHVVLTERFHTPVTIDARGATQDDPVFIASGSNSWGWTYFSHFRIE